MTKQKDLVHDIVRRCVIDLNQAEAYYDNSQYDGYEKNLKDVVNRLSELVEKTRSRLS